MTQAQHIRSLERQNERLRECIRALEQALIAVVEHCREHHRS